MAAEIDRESHVNRLTDNCTNQLIFDSDDILNESDRLSDITTNYDSIFSWNISKYATGNHGTKGTDFLWKIYQKIDLAHNNHRKFNLDLFCLNLISCYEMFSTFEYTQAICKIKDVIRTLRCTQMDAFFDQISDACFHIAYVTQAYIMVNLHLDVKKILTNIKPKSDFNKVEKAAILGIRSKVLLEYSLDNDAVLDLIESARNLNNEEMLWTNIWLKAKRRKRTFDQNLSFPFREELEAANKLKTSNNLEFLTSAASVYAEAGYTLHLKRSRTNLRESIVYNKLAADLIIIVFNLAKNDIKLLYHCLSCLNNLPSNIISKRIINQIVNKLAPQENYKVQKALGKYFLKNKDYKTARNYFKKSSRSFSSSLMLIKVECLLSSVDNFPVVQYLRLLYTSCTSSKKKRYISAQILLYYMYNENDNKKELLYCLDTYLFEHLDIISMKIYITEIRPLFLLNKRYKHSTFINDMGNNIEQLKAYPNWNPTEQIILERVVSKFHLVDNSEQMDEFIDTEMSCVVCQFHKACCVLRPCGHQCVCKSCWNSLRNNSNMCPICRTVVDYYLNC